MKTTICLVLIFLGITTGYSQDGYPRPPHVANRLFYIQHSNNQNTYVYDLNIKNGVIDDYRPIKEYRILYTQNGVHKALSPLQKRLAYGMVLVDSTNNVLRFRLAATNKVFFYLNKSDAKLYVTVNNHKMYLDRLFIKLKSESKGIHYKSEYILFYGHDYYSEKPVVEKFFLQ